MQAARPRVVPQSRPHHPPPGAHGVVAHENGHLPPARDQHAHAERPLHRRVTQEHAEAEDLKVTLERAAAEIRLADASRELTSAKEEEKECVAVSEAWGIVELLVRWGKCSEAVTAAQLVIGEREQTATPALNALNAAAKTLRRALMAMASEAERSAEAELGLAAETSPAAIRQCTFTVRSPPQTFWVSAPIQDVHGPAFTVSVRVPLMSASPSARRGVAVWLWRADVG